MRACMFIVRLIVYGSRSLWHNKVKLLNPFAADNAISQGHPEREREAGGVGDFSAETRAPVSHCAPLLWFSFGTGQERQPGPTRRDRRAGTDGRLRGSRG